MKLATYLTFDGKARDAFEFYARCLGGKVGMSMTYGESPMGEQTPPEQKNRLLHVSLQVGDQILYGSDAPPPYFSQPQGFSVSVSIHDPAEAERVFGALSENGNVKMPIQETFWATRFGMLVDQYGTPWMVNCEKTYTP